MNLTCFSDVALYRNKPRLWFSSRRLETLGFTPGEGFNFESAPGRLTLRRGLLATNHVSYKRAQNGRRPVIDINSSIISGVAAPGEEIKIVAVPDAITITPSVRTFHIRRAYEPRERLRVVELFAGGGTLSQAAAASRRFEILAAMEINPDYADVYSAAHPATELFQADIRKVHPSELPQMDVLLAGIPCTSHSNLGITHQGLKGNRSELGETGDLFMSVVSIVTHHMPRACVFENVPFFGTSLAGLALRSHLEKLGYACTAAVISPNEEWDEPCDRRRWVMIATLKPGFSLENPMTPFTGTMAEFLDTPDPVRDLADVQKASNRVTLLERHVAKHKAKGNGFKMTFVRYEDSRCPTITRSYHHVNRGPLVVTPYGLRLLRQQEIERLHGATAATNHYVTAVEVLGQGVLTRVFANIFEQLARFL